MTGQGYEKSHDEGSGGGIRQKSTGGGTKAGRGHRTRQDKQGVGRGGQRGREVRIIPPIIVCSRSGSLSPTMEALRLLQSSTWGQETYLP